MGEKNRTPYLKQPNSIRPFVAQEMTTQQTFPNIPTAPEQIPREG